MIADLLHELNGMKEPAALAGSRAVLDVRHVVVEDVSPQASAASGIRHVVRSIAREQIAAGDDARIIVLTPDRHGDAGPLDLPTLILPLDGPRFAGHVVGLVPQLVAALTAGAGRDTVFHIHTARQPLLPALMSELARRGLAFGVTVHGRSSHRSDRNGGFANRGSALHLRRVARRAIEQARFVHAVSATEADVIRRLAPHARICVVPNAAYSSALDGVPVLPRHTASSAGFPTFGYCGRYEIFPKDLDLLVEGFAAYRRQGGKGKLALIGTGPARDTIAAMAAGFGITDAVEVQEPCFGEEKQRRMQGWDFFVQPSPFDGVPIGALEAALAGLPLIVSTETGLASAITSADAGIVIGMLTADAIAGAFAEASAIAPDAWTRMAASAHAMAVAIGDWTPIAGSLRKLYLSA